MMMRTLISAMILAVLTLIPILGSAPSVAAEETTCTGAIGPVTVDNLLVPDGAQCTLNGTQVMGTIKVGSQSSLAAANVSVVGNVQSQGHASINLNGSTVGGSVQLEKGGFFDISDNGIEGSIQVKENSGQSQMSANQVNQDVQVFNHANGVDITSNTIDGNLQCKENNPAPTGGNNTVGGNKEDQCEIL